MALKIVGIASAYPPQILTNADLEAELLKVTPDGGESFQRVIDKTKIFRRHIARAETTALDLATEAAGTLAARHPEEFAQVDFIIHCTQSPEYLLPSTSCILQSRLSMSAHVGALDVNLGCSGYVYCLSLADAMLRAKHAKAVLVTTADTYTHYLHPHDFTNRLIFGDGAAATLLVDDPETPASRFTHWTDGRSAQHLILQKGGMKYPGCVPPQTVSEEFQSPDPNYLYMNGFEVFRFGITSVPLVMKKFLNESGKQLDEFDWFIPHQANAYMLSELNQRLKVADDRVAHFYEDIGNTVSTSIPAAIEAYHTQGRIRTGQQLLLAGFGVGFSVAIGNVCI